MERGPSILSCCAEKYRGEQKKISHVFAWIFLGEFGGQIFGRDSSNKISDAISPDHSIVAG
jgi:hypothetical protein